MGGQFTSGRFRYNDKENAGLTPATFEIAFEDVTFASRDGVRLSGWWVPATAARGTVVLVHGLNRSRIEMVKKLPFVHRSGWSALLFDLRHHGESGGGISTFGAREKDDVLARWWRLSVRRVPVPSSSGAYPSAPPRRCSRWMRIRRSMP